MRMYINKMLKQSKTAKNESPRENKKKNEIILDKTFGILTHLEYIIIYRIHIYRTHFLLTFDSTECMSYLRLFYFKYTFSGQRLES